LLSLRSNGLPVRSLYSGAGAVAHAAPFVVLSMIFVLSKFTAMRSPLTQTRLQRRNTV
jgi:hypothetical protein